ncbi:YceI family protein [Lysobacter sp. GX 14042]|uniref:YceI family protein n=1 Tax=Lysobacter sp. GX 14042 TaxID=2907155 RepID=UPI001F18C5CD|nr:YceI family protein [Lysobacter sp. GX 14042]MCE7032288.1 YceI family protein [Lysobacter sp. GX 14042]
MLAALLLQAGTLSPAAAVTPVPGEQALDRQRSQAGFRLRTRWGQRIEGRLPLLEGERRVLADGRHQVRIVLDARQVEVEDSGRLDAIARGDRFFDADVHPRIVFLSDPYPPGLLEVGGDVPGWLQVRGIRRPEVFTLEPSACPEPGNGCAVHAHGSIERADYGMDAMRLALTGQVLFELRLWLLEPGS